MQGHTNWHGEQVPTPSMPQNQGFPPPGVSASIQVPTYSDWPNQSFSGTATVPFPIQKQGNWPDPEWGVPQAFSHDAGISREWSGAATHIAPSPSMLVLPNTQGEIPVQPSLIDTNAAQPSALWYLNNAVWNAPSGFDRLEKSSLAGTHFKRNILLPLTQPMPASNASHSYANSQLHGQQGIQGSDRISEEIPTINNPFLRRPIKGYRLRKETADEREQQDKNDL
jgi:hypothetical protein